MNRKNHLGVSKSNESSGESIGAAGEQNRDRISMFKERGWLLVLTDTFSWDTDAAATGILP